MPEVGVVLLVGALAAAMMTVPFLHRHAFYYGGDNPESFVPLWHHFGQQLRAGQWPTMDPAGWYGGNYAAEGTYALWNPVQVLDYLLVSLFDDLAAAAALVQIQFLALLAMGSYLLFREYGAGRLAAVAVATGIPTIGFTVFYEANGWPAGLMAFTWVTWFWWAALRQSHGRLLPLVPFVLGALGMTTGNPYAALGMVIVLLGLAVELLVRRETRRLVHLVVTGACVGAVAALVFLPMLGTLPVTDRQEVAGLMNSGFLVPQLGDVAGASSPSYLPAILNWGGALFERRPSTYFIWFAWPLLPWLRWREVRRPGGRPTSVLVIATVFGALSLGPSNLWLFRWPIRFIEYFYLALAVLLALALSRGLATDAVRTRVAATVGIVGIGAYLAFSTRPDIYAVHAVATFGVLALVLLAVAATHRRGRVAGAAVLVLGTALVLLYQSVKFPLPTRSASAEPLARVPASLISQARDTTSSHEGTVLQLGDLESLETPRLDLDGALLFGNLGLMTGRETVVRYSGMGFAEFNEALCMDYRGQVCPEAFDRIWAPVEGIGVPLVDLMEVQTLVIDAHLLPGPAGAEPPRGWSVAARDDLRTVWVRDEAPNYAGRLSWASRDIDVLSERGAGTSETVAFDADTAGDLVFARLAWPGYSATVDGEPVEVSDGPAGLLSVAVPAGEHTLELEFRSPGLTAGIVAAVLAAVVSLVQTAVWLVPALRRRRGGPAAGPAAPSDRSEPTPREALAGTAGRG
ncbi:glycosyltransferase family protein [Blastococcus atacamensis]|uniref:hypothetical protein n=1 Tax=Blastococcus atacamensis TaxID=2070508 RepID=UPI000CECA565|nr:hypothetical protein [Blastococcus atacamensis]